MTPSQLSGRLRRIASALDASKSPDREAVARALTAALDSFSGTGMGADEQEVQVSCSSMTTVRVPRPTGFDPENPDHDMVVAMNRDAEEKVSLMAERGGLDNVVVNAV
jgi:hypothetical protein